MQLFLSATNFIYLVDIKDISWLFIDS